MDDFELKRLQLKEQALKRAARDRQNAAREEKVTFPPLEDGCSICGKTVTGLVADRCSKLAVVICHPWGPMGGSMHDATVSTLLSLFGQGAGLTTLRFNFRTGVGRGHSSAADIQGACRFLLHSLKHTEQVLLVGYSYGGSVVASIAADIAEVSAFIIVAPPLGFNRALFMGRSPITPRLLACKKPKLLLIGDTDQFCKEVGAPPRTRPLPAGCPCSPAHHCQLSRRDATCKPPPPYGSPLVPFRPSTFGACSYWLTYTCTASPSPHTAPAALPPHLFLALPRRLISSTCTAHSRSPRSMRSSTGDCSPAAVARTTRWRQSTTLISSSTSRVARRATLAAGSAPLSAAPFRSCASATACR